MPSAGSAPSTSTALTSARRAGRSVLDRSGCLLRGSGHSNLTCAATPSTSCGARSAAAGSSWSTSMFHRPTATEIDDGILGCHCCIFPVVDGIPVLHLQPGAIAAREHIEAGRPGSRAAGDGRPRATEAEAERFEAAAASDRPRTGRSSRRSGRASKAATFSTASRTRPSSSPNAVVRAVAGAVLHGGRGGPSTSAAGPDT